MVSELKLNLEKRGYRVLPDNTIKGRSGETHVFDLLAEDAKGSKHAYLITGKLDQLQLVGIFVAQLDSEATVHVIALEELTPDALKLAKSYGIEVKDQSNPESKPIGRQRGAEVEG